MKKLLLIGVPAAVVLVGLVVWWVVLRGDPPPAATLPERPAATTAAPGTTGPAAPAPATPDGVWVVEPGEQVFGGYRVSELFAGETLQKVAVGRSPAVSGTITVAAGQLVASRIEVDLTQLASGSARRDARLRVDGLETDTHPTATFELTGPVSLGVPAVGQTVQVELPGALTLHGVTRAVTVPVQARWNGATIDVAGGVVLALADFGIRPPSIPNVVEVADQGVLEVQLTFVPG